MPAMTKPLMGRSSEVSKYRSELGQYMRDLRHKAGLSQVELSDRVGLAYYSVISAIENGRIPVPPERYLAFANALDVAPKTFAKNVLKLTNPWAYTMLYSADPANDIEAINDQLIGPGVV